MKRISCDYHIMEVPCVEKINVNVGDKAKN